jgi:hypothetical protein
MPVTRNRVSVRGLARLTGGLYLVIMVTAMFAEAFVRNRLIVSGDPAGTLRNISAHLGAWRWGIAADLSTTLADVAVAALLFVLLRPISRAASLSAAAFRVAYSAAMVAGTALLIAPLQLIDHPPPGLAPAEAQALVSFALRLHDSIFLVALTLFGVHLMIVGGLIARATFLPRLLGPPLALAGLCYVANSFLRILSPTVADDLFPWILLPGFIAEGALTLWLLVAGVNLERWRVAVVSQADVG